MTTGTLKTTADSSLLGFCVESYLIKPWQLIMQQQWCSFVNWLLAATQWLQVISKVLERRLQPVFLQVCLNLALHWLHVILKSHFSPGILFVFICLMSVSSKTDGTKEQTGSRWKTLMWFKFDLPTASEHTALWSINQSHCICVAHIHKSQFVSMGFNRVWHPLPLTLNKSEDIVKGYDSH